MDKNLADLFLASQFNFIQSRLFDKPFDDSTKSVYLD